MRSRSVRRQPVLRVDRPRVIWGCDDNVIQDRDRIHPLVWHPTEWMADSFVCGSCDAGWIEPDDAEPITWIRPYWRVGDA